MALKPGSMRAFLQAAAAMALALVVGLVFKHRWMGAAAALAALLLFVSGFIPPLHATLEKGTAFLALAAGVLMGWVLLVPVYYLCFTTGRLILRLAGKDSLHKSWDKQKESYWNDHGKPAPSDHYQRQY